MEFHETIVGRRFFEGQLPEILQEMRRLNTNLEKMNSLSETGQDLIGAVSQSFEQPEQTELPANADQPDSSPEVTLPGNVPNIREYYVVLDEALERIFGTNISAMARNYGTTETQALLLTTLQNPDPVETVDDHAMRIGAELELPFQAPPAVPLPEVPDAGSDNG